jgi:ribokinase
LPHLTSKVEKATMSQDMPPRILVLGSLNLDLVLLVPRLPDAGETLACDHGAQFCGGKGANQAVACARLGAAVTMIGHVGDDPSGIQLRTALAQEGIAIEAITAIPGTTSGQAIILLTPDGQNRILLVGGANAALSPADVARHHASFDTADLLICQLEVPLNTVMAAIDRARACHVPVLLNPAPARTLPADLLVHIDYLIPNESEATFLSGITVQGPDSAAKAAVSLRRQGARTVIVTLGAAGILIADAQGCRHLPAFPATVVDTTAAGDSFIGGLAVGITEGLGIDDAARLGLHAASVCVGRHGAQAALPRRAEL